MLNQYEKKVFQNCTVKASDFSFSNSSRKDTVNVNCSKDTPTVMNPSFPHEDTTACFQSRIWLLHSRVCPDRCKTIESTSCLAVLSEAEVPELIKA